MAALRIVIAPDKFKGSLTAAEAAQAIARGIRPAQPDAILDLCPMADGGEGTVAAMVASTGGRFETTRVTGPLPEMKVPARWGVLGDGTTAIIEMSAASGLALLKPEDRNPQFTTTFGTGELLMAAAGKNVGHIVLGIGGSATIDAGIGCAQACGLPVILEDGQPISLTEPLCGRDLDTVLMVKHGRGSAIERVRITVACDVSNPLFGLNGAARVYGPQKGASPQQVIQLDDSLRQLAERTGKLAEARKPGAGAAGGLGFAMLAWFGATLRSGVEIVIDATKLRQRLAGAELCITGEGRLDASSLHGKAPIGVARLCRELGVRCIALAGSIGDGADLALTEGLESFHALASAGMTLDESMRHAAAGLTQAASTLAKSF